MKRKTPIIFWVEIPKDEFTYLPTFLFNMFKPITQNFFNPEAPYVNGGLREEDTYRFGDKNVKGQGQSTNIVS